MFFKEAFLPQLTIRQKFDEILRLIFVKSEQSPPMMEDIRNEIQVPLLLNGKIDYDAWADTYLEKVRKDCKSTVSFHPNQ